MKKPLNKGLLVSAMLLVLAVRCGASSPRGFTDERERREREKRERETTRSAGGASDGV